MESSLDRIASAFLLPSLKRVLPTFLLSTAYNSVRTESSTSRSSSRHVFVRVSELHSFDYLVYHRQLTDTSIVNVSRTPRPHATSTRYFQLVPEQVSKRRSLNTDEGSSCDGHLPAGLSTGFEPVSHSAVEAGRVIGI